MENRLQLFMYDDSLSPMARIFMAEISMYFGTPVECLDNEMYFAVRFKVTKRNVRRWKKELIDAGYLKSVKNEFGKRVLRYEPNIEHRKVDKEMEVIFVTYEGIIIHNTFEALVYFNKYLDRLKLSDNVKGDLRIFCHTFANCLFDEKSYSLQFKNGAVTSLEFMQYIMAHWKMKIVFNTAMNVIKKYNGIDNINLYVLSSLAKLYKDEFEIAKKQKNYADFREQLKNPLDRDPAMIKMLQKELDEE